MRRLIHSVFLRYRLTTFRVWFDELSNQDFAIFDPFKPILDGLKYEMTPRLLRKPGEMGVGHL